MHGRVLHELLIGKIANYAERLQLVTSPRALGERPSVTPRNGLCLGGRRITLIAHLLGLPRTPRLSSRAESGGGALGLIWKSGRGVPLRGLGEVGFLSGRCASRNRRSPAKPIAVAGLPWLLQLPGAEAAVARSSKYCWLRPEAAPASGCQAHRPR